MKTLWSAIAALGVLATGAAAAATDAPEDADSPMASDTAGRDDADLEAQLNAASARLDEAARQVAELSAQIGRPVMDRFLGDPEHSRRAIIGVQLDPGGGKEGATVREVSPGGPAAEAGIQARDVIVSVNGQAVKGDSTREVTRMIRDAQPDSRLNMRILRNGKPRDFVIIARPTVFAFSSAPPPVPPEPPEPPMPGFATADAEEMPFLMAFGGDFADMELTALTPELGRYFGTAEGILVVRAPKQSGLKLEDGDVILSIDGRKPSTGSHATRILRSYQPGEKVALKVMRQKKPVDLDVTLPERKDLFRNRTYRTQEPS